jgi:hypothetical protein
MANKDQSKKAPKLNKPKLTPKEKKEKKANKAKEREKKQGQVGG